MYVSVGFRENGPVSKCPSFRVSSWFLVFAQLEQPLETEMQDYWWPWDIQGVILGLASVNCCVMGLYTRQLQQLSKPWHWTYRNPHVDFCEYVDSDMCMHSTNRNYNNWAQQHRFYRDQWYAVREDRDGRNLLSSAHARNDTLPTQGHMYFQRMLCVIAVGLCALYGRWQC
jgi:hypothetical protein